jgi:hypothetical protein
MRTGSGQRAQGTGEVIDVYARLRKPFVMKERCFV